MEWLKALSSNLISQKQTNKQTNKQTTRGRKRSLTGLTVLIWKSAGGGSGGSETSFSFHLPYLSAFSSALLLSALGVSLWEAM
jgi:FMN-dependent NADH-azoreductase